MPSPSTSLTSSSPISNPDQLITRHNLAWNVEQQGRHGEAEQICRRVLADRERLLGDHHPDAHNTRFRLACIIASQGRRAEATALMTQVLAARQQLLGHSHPDTITSQRELARLALDQTCIRADRPSRAKRS